MQSAQGSHQQSNQQVKQILSQAGLSGGEIKVYLALLQLGSTTTGPIIAQSRISRSKVYDILGKLLEKGLASVHLHKNAKHFVAAPPQRVTEFLNQKQAQIADLSRSFETFIPQLSARQKETGYSSVKIYVGFEGAKTFFLEMRHRNKLEDDYYGYAFTDDALQNKPLLRLFDNFLKERAEHGARSFILCNSRDRLNKKRMVTSTRNFQFRETSAPFPPNIDVFGDIVAHTSWEDGGKIFVIEDKMTARNYQNLFLRLWKTAKRF